jgi:hypothetical protein
MPDEPASLPSFFADLRELRNALGELQLTIRGYEEELRLLRDDQLVQARPSQEQWLARLYENHRTLRARLMELLERYAESL